jgi:uncharacterized membrane protein YhaH (DUF805 family)
MENERTSKQMAQEFITMAQKLHEQECTIKYLRVRSRILSSMGRILRKAYHPVIMFWLCLLIVLIGLWVVRSVYEAKTFNEITGKNVSWKQALWVQLRVQEP